jgi:hypothetical protein
MKPARASSEDLKALLTRWVAHKQNGNLAFSRAIFRSYTRDSLLGRLVRRHVVLNPLAPVLLKDAVEAAGERRPLDPPFVADSPAAAALLAQAPPPHTDLAGSRKVPMQREARAAAADYARERIALITEADALIGPSSVWRHNLMRELRCWRRLLDLLRSRAEQPGLKGAHNARHGPTGEAL